jgi:hypothetical protein
LCPNVHPTRCLTDAVRTVARLPVPAPLPSPFPTPGALSPICPPPPGPGCGSIPSSTSCMNFRLASPSASTRPTGAARRRSAAGHLPLTRPRRRSPWRTR